MPRRQQVLRTEKNWKNVLTDGRQLLTRRMTYNGFNRTYFFGVWTGKTHNKRSEAEDHRFFEMERQLATREIKKDLNDIQSEQSP